MTRLLLGAFALFAAASCGSDAGVAPTTTTSAATTTEPAAPATTSLTPTTTAPAPSSAGCGNAVAAGTTMIEIVTADGLVRTATQLVPVDYDANDATAIVINFHGFSSAGTAHHAWTDLTATAERETFIVVSPQGTVAPVFEQTFWNTESGSPLAGFDGELVDDVAFTEALIEDLSSRLCVDPDRIHATGLSNGGLFSSRLACDLSPRIASVATIAGIFNPPACDQERSVPLLAIHGTADPVLPFDATRSNLGDLLALDDDAVFALLVGERLPVPEIVDRWAEVNGCATTVTTTTIGSDVERRDYEGCDASTAFVIVTGGGHTWPGSTPQLEAILGPTTQTFFASDMIWDFFVAHPRAEA